MPLKAFSKHAVIVATRLRERIAILVYRFQGFGLEPHPHENPLRDWYFLYCKTLKEITEDLAAHPNYKKKNINIRDSSIGKPK